MPLHEYRRKRDFSRSSEPEGQTKTADKPRPRRRQEKLQFVVQKHRASRLHYDLRLQYGDVLKSWAVPKGPCLDPKEKRLAIEVEDHPLEYIDFEGVIPPDEYGGGTVLVWDRGTWTTGQDAVESYEQGMIKFELSGEKLTGSWMLVKIKPQDGERDRHWLLVKERDDQVRRLSEEDVLQSQPASVLSGRMLHEVAANPDCVWKDGRAQPLGSKRRRPRFRWNSVTDAVAAEMPEQICPQLATLVESPPEGEEWIHEIKFDGYRMMCFVGKPGVEFRTRSNLDWTHRFPHLVQCAEALPVTTAILDGEVVALTPEGVSCFPTLQSAFQRGHVGQLVYYVFDLLYLNGRDLRKCPLWQRKELLQKIVDSQGNERIQFTDHIVGRGREFAEKCQHAALEGVVSKRANGPHRAGRSQEWKKSKFRQQIDVVIGGYTRPKGARQGLGALVVGYYDQDDRLVYAGRVGSGFDDMTLRELQLRLDASRQANSPFAGRIPEKTADVTWVTPELVARVEFANWTGDGNLRQPVYRGLREDAQPYAVARLDTERTQKFPSRPAGVRTKEQADSLADQSHHNAVAGARLAAQPLSDEQWRQLEGMRMTNPGRILYPELGVTKLDLAAYYVDIANWILPHVAKRPLSLVRGPDGVEGDRFFQKHSHSGVSDAVLRTRITTKDGAKDHLYIQDVAGLAAMAQMNVLELHVWGARVDRVERPDRIIFDLDPAPDVPWHRVIECALRLRQVLRDLSLQGFVKTSGGKGLHICVPIQRRHTWTQAKDFSRAVARSLAAEHPKQITASVSKAARQGRTYIDFLRNTRGATTVAAYSTRARFDGAVSTPVSWDELTTLPSASHYTIRNLRERLKSLAHDPWESIHAVRQSITVAIREELGLSW